jgi:hypothetical protein
MLMHACWQRVITRYRYAASPGTSSQADKAT